MLSLILSIFLTLSLGFFTLLRVFFLSVHLHLLPIFVSCVLHTAFFFSLPLMGRTAHDMTAYFLSATGRRCGTMCPRRPLVTDRSRRRVRLAARAGAFADGAGELRMRAIKVFALRYCTCSASYILSFRTYCSKENASPQKCKPRACRLQTS
jgi:hypothetical protein